MRKSVKSFVAVTLTACMCFSSAFVALADDRNITENTNISGWDYPNDTLVMGGDYTLTVDEGSQASVRGINGGGENGTDHSVTISGGGTLNVESSTGNAITAQSVTVENTTVNATASAGEMGASNAIQAQNNVTINNATVNADASGSYMFSSGINSSSGNVNINNSNVNASGNATAIIGSGVNITNSTVNANTNNPSGGQGIAAQNNVNINNSDVNAKGTNDAMQAGNIVINNSTIATPEGAVIKKAPGTSPWITVYESNGTTVAGEVKIAKGSAAPEEPAAPVAPADPVVSEPVPVKTNNNTDTGSSSAPATPAPAPAPADAVTAAITATVTQTAVFTGNLAGSSIEVKEVSLTAKAAFTEAVPSGWTQGFSFSISTSGQTGFTVKNGKMSFKVPDAIKKAGRKFAIMGVDKNGKVKIFDNIDTTGENITIDLDIEGFEFEVIYAD